MAHPMATAYKAGNEMQASLNEYIQVKKELDRNTNGSCNACTPATQKEEYSTVTQVELRGLVFRLCPACSKTLKLAL